MVRFYINYTLMAQGEYEQRDLSERYVEQGELDVAQSTGSLELALETSEGFAGIEREGLPDDEKLRLISQETLVRANRIFEDAAFALHGHRDPESLQAVVDTVIGKGKGVNASVEGFMEFGKLSREEAELELIKTRADSAADQAAGNAKRAGVERSQQNKLAGEKREVEVKNAARDIVTGRLFRHFEKTLEGLSERLQAAGEAEQRAA